MSRRIQIVISLALIALISGCMLLPIPRFDYYAPAISGVITRNEVPIENAQIQVSTKYGDLESKITTTRPDGHFSTESIRKFSPVTVVLGDFSSVYSLQIIVDGKIYNGYLGAMSNGSSKELKLRCELSHPSDLKHFSEQVYCEN
jgi:hypothetical protein